MASRDTPGITLTTTTSHPVTHTTRSTYTIGGRRNKNRDSQASDEAYLRASTPTHDIPEPFPTLATPTPDLRQTRSNQDYFSQPPAQYQIRSRPIGIRRLPSSTAVDHSTLTRRKTNEDRSQRHSHHADSSNDATAGLAGLPGHYDLAPQPGMETIGEDHAVNHGTAQKRDSVGSNRMRRASNAASTVARSIASKLSDDNDDQRTRSRRNTRDYEGDVVDYLDVLDPEVSTLTTLNNVQNALFVPDIPFLNRFYNRNPTYTLSRNPTHISERTEPENGSRPQLARTVSRQQPSYRGSYRGLPPTPGPPPVPSKTDEQEERVLERGNSRTPDPDMMLGAELNRSNSITSHVEDDRYAVLPHGVTLEGWSKQDVEDLDDYVRHMLHSRRNKFKRSMRGFGKYIKKPLGFFVTLYAFLITAFGLIWVLFLIGWIYLGSRKDYIVHIVDSVLVGLFAIMGDGLAPFRTIDTYHMIYIAHYHRLSWKLRKQKKLPKLPDHNDLPERSQKEIAAEADAGLATKSEEHWQFSVLSPEQQKKLLHHQNKFSKSHAYYRPHETSTHHAFPLKLLITIVTLLDLHSVLQIMLGCFTWGWSYHTRPEWITAVILSFSITANITAGVLISVGNKRTRKKDVVLRMMRQGLTEEAMRKLEKDKREAGQEVTHVQQSVDVAHAINVQQGITQPEGHETKQGALEVKEKLEGYKQTLEGRREEDERATKEKAVEERMIQRENEREGVKGVDMFGPESSGSGSDSFNTGRQWKAGDSSYGR